MRLCDLKHEIGDTITVTIIGGVLRKVDGVWKGFYHTDIGVDIPAEKLDNDEDKRSRGEHAGGADMPRPMEN